MGKRARMQLCTHITMDRIAAGDQDCDICGRVPSIGFLYECAQDSYRETAKDMFAQHQSQYLASDSKSDLRVRLENVGLSESVIANAESGGYTDTQLEKLITLKKELRQTIIDEIQVRQMNRVVARLSAFASGSSVSGTDGTGATRPEQITTCSNPCNIQACHHCRPYYRDRVPISIDSLLTDNFAPLTPDEIARLPTKSAQIMRTIGLNTPPSSPATQSSMQDSSSTSKSFVNNCDLPRPASTTSNSESSGSEATFKTSQTDADDGVLLRSQAMRRNRLRYRPVNVDENVGEAPRQGVSATRAALRARIQELFRPTNLAAFSMVAADAEDASEDDAYMSGGRSGRAEFVNEALNCGQNDETEDASSSSAEEGDVEDEGATEY